MAASPYLQNAAAQVRSAIADLQKQIKTMEGDFDRERRDIERNVKSNEGQMMALTAGMLAKDEGDSNRQIRMQIVDLKKQNDQHNQQISERHSQMSRAIADRQSLLGSLQSLAGQLDGMASSSGAQ